MLHPWHDIHPGEHVPEEFWAVIEIPMSATYKYELDKPTGLLKVDRSLHSAVYYPANYGFIPMTYAPDDDPLDVLVLGVSPVAPLTLIRSRAIGMMTMKDENEIDDKIIAVHVNDPEYAPYQDIAELPSHKLNVLQRFFEDYKALENKEVIVERFRDRFEAHHVIIQSLHDYEARIDEGEPFEGTERWAASRNPVPSISELLQSKRKPRRKLLTPGEENVDVPVRKKVKPPKPSKAGSANGGSASKAAARKPVNGNKKQATTRKAAKKTSGKGKSPKSS